MNFFRMILFVMPCLFGCVDTNPAGELKSLLEGENIGQLAETEIEPVVVTESVEHDTDDPAIWIHPSDPAKSLVIGTDKNEEGALYAFDLEGKIVKVVKNLVRPNNVDVAYGFTYRDEKIDIAVVTERYKQRIRVFKLPELEAIDAGDMIVFGGDTDRAPMGVAVYKRPADDAFFVIVSGKSGPSEGYLGQYLLQGIQHGQVQIRLIREYGRYSGKKEIEAIAVDNELGYVYYSDETAGVRKYNADPDAPDADVELAFFADEGFELDQEGISIYKKDETTGYIIVSDQQADQFWLFPREGSSTNPHEHLPVKVVKASTDSSDGSDVVSTPLPGFPEGLFVAMTEGKKFHYYSWTDMIGN